MSRNLELRSSSADPGFVTVELDVDSVTLQPRIILHTGTGDLVFDLDLGLCKASRCVDHRIGLLALWSDVFIEPSKCFFDEMLSCPVTYIIVLGGITA